VDSSTKAKVREEYEKAVLEVLRGSVKAPYDAYISEFIDQLMVMVEKLNNSDVETRNKFRYGLSILTSPNSKPNIIRAKINAYYAYLVYRGYTSAYNILKNKLVAGGESLYTWIRMYRSLNV
jgi:hypothetical protein